MAVGKTKTKKNYKNMETPWPNKTWSKIVGALYGMEKKTKIAGRIPGQPRRSLRHITLHKERSEYVCPLYITEYGSTGYSCQYFSWSTEQGK